MARARRGTCGRIVGRSGFLSQALAGAVGFFVLLPPNPGGDDFTGPSGAPRTGSPQAVKDGAPPHVVLLSSVGADLAEGTGPIKGLHYLEESAARHGHETDRHPRILFQENIASVIPAARQQGIYPNFLPRPIWRSR